MKDITVEAKVENIDVVTNFVNDILEENCCPMKIQMQIDVVMMKYLEIFHIMLMALMVEKLRYRLG